ncbi:MAG: hypothetical protein ACOZB0_04935 [Pseudomonadota bacterium]
MEIAIHRTPPLATEARSLPAAVYNLGRTLLARSPGVLFVPIRSMQFLAILDAEEIIFVDHLEKNWAVLAWRSFRPQLRDTLDAPVSFEAAYYRADAAGLMRQLQGDYAKALQALASKTRFDGPARVLKFERP